MFRNLPSGHALIVQKSEKVYLRVQDPPKSAKMSNKSRLKPFILGKVIKKFMCFDTQSKQSLTRWLANFNDLEEKSNFAVKAERFKSLFSSASSVHLVD